VSLHGFIMNTSLVVSLSRNWWVLLLRGIAAIAFGVLAWFWPGVTLITLVMLYGVYAAADGILALIAAIKGGTVAPRWWLMLAGLFGLAAAAATFFYPGLTAVVLLIFIGAWAIAHGVMEIVGAIKLRKEIAHEGWLIFGGAMSVLFGFVVLIWPGAGALALVWLIAVYAVAFGLMLIGFAFRLRRVGHVEF
jgi:uncharacterized membrane protein HdeD (DUF308 family)